MNLRRLSVRLLIILIGIISIVAYFTADSFSSEVNPPHNQSWATNPNKQITCSNGCHVATGSTVSLTASATNPGLCMTCHTGLGWANNLPFGVNDQANWNTGAGTSHRWDRIMNAGASPLNLSSGNPNNPFGLRPYEDMPTSSPIQQMLSKFSGGAVCSACHNQHYQLVIPWDPNGGSVDSGTASAGTTTTVTDGSKAWTANQWVNSYVWINSGTSKGAIRQIKSNTANTLTIYNTNISTDPVAVKSAFPSPIAAGNAYYILSRQNHLQRVQVGWTTDANSELCTFCHYYRDTNVSSNPQSARYQVWDGNKRSHPVNIIFTGDQGETPTPDAGRPGWTTFFNTAPLEPIAVWSGGPISTIARQTGSQRYSQNGGWWTNSTNNIVLDSNANIRCLSCHGIHYTYSDSTIPNGPPQ